MRHLLGVIVCSIAWTLGCAGGGVAAGGAEPPAAPAPTGQAEDPADEKDWCVAAEVQLEKLACRDPRGDPMWINRNGERFHHTCHIAQKEGGVFLNPRCIAHAQSCQEVDACPAQ